MHRNFSEIDGFYECLENWIIKAEHINIRHEALELKVKDDLTTLIRHLSNILYCCLSDYGKITKEEKDRRWIFNHELATAWDKFEVVHHQLSNLMKKSLK